MSDYPYLSAAFMVIDSYFLDDGLVLSIEAEAEYPEIYSDDSFNLSLGDFVVKHSSTQDLSIRDVL